MFGQSAAVHGFLFFGRAIAVLAASLLDIVVVEFFDDFTQIETAAAADSAQESLIKLLGWRLRKTEKKRKPFMGAFVARGVLVALEKSDERVVKLRNKPGRVEVIADQVKGILDSPSCRPGERSHSLTAKPIAG